MKLNKYMGGLLAICAAIATPAQADSQLQLNDVFQLRYADSPIVSHDGKRLIYTRRSMDIMKDKPRSNLWVTDIGGEKQRPLTTGAKNVGGAVLASDDNRLAFVDQDDTGAQIFVRWLDTGATAQLTRMAQSPMNLSWSPDGKWLAFAMLVPKEAPTMGKMPAAPKGAEWATAPTVVERTIYRADGQGNLPHGFYQLFVLSADGGNPRQITDDEFDYTSAILWSANNETLFTSANRTDDPDLAPAESDIYSIDVASGSVTGLTDRNGPDGSSMSLSADGKLIAYTGWDDKRMGYSRSRLYVMNVDGSGKRELLADLDRSIQNIQWSKEGKRLYFQYDDKGDTRLAMTDLSNNMTQLAAGIGGKSLGRPYSGGEYAVGGNGVYAYTTGTAQSPANIATGKSGKNQQITNLNANLLNQRSLAKVEEFWLKSSADQLDIQAWLATPADFDPNKKYPLILEIHGGPFANYGSRFSAEIQLYAAAGYVVLYLNPRGSTSYGEAFANQIHHAYPSTDYDDLMSAVDVVIGRGFIDDKRLFVTGGSGGGTLTAWVVGKTDRFRAAVVAKPVINWTSFSLYADASPYFTQYWFDKKPWEDQQSYWDRSPLSLVGNVSTPTMLLTGEDDLRTPMPESEQYYEALKLRGIDTAMVRVPGASHSIARRPSQLVAKVVAILEWFERYDEPAAPAAAAAPNAPAAPGSKAAKPAAPSSPNSTLISTSRSR